MYKWKFNESPDCDCGTDVQHIILNCQLRRYKGDLEDFLKTIPKAVAWLDSLDVEI